MNPYESPTQSDIAEKEPQKPKLARRVVYGAVATNLIGSLLLWGLICLGFDLARGIPVEWFPTQEWIDRFMQGLPVVLLICAANTLLYLAGLNRKIQRQASAYTRHRLTEEAKR